MSNLLTYSPEDITILVAGVVPIDGYIDGSFLTIRKDISPFSSKTTSDGVFSRTYRNSQSYTVSITLHNLSASNEVLDALLKWDEITQTGKFPLIIKDQLGNSFFYSATSWIETPADMEYATSITERRWVIRCSQAIMSIGGNDSESDLLENLTRALVAASPTISGLLS